MLSQRLFASSRALFASWNSQGARLYGSDNVGKCLQELGDISVTPGSEEYETKTKIYNPAFAMEHPAFVALPTCVEDIQRCLKVATINRVPIAVRSGGHCFSGYSTIDSRGFVVSMNSMKDINWSTDSVKVQSGASWKNVYDHMDDSVLVVGGCCPSVGIGGYVLGGGYGLLSRRFGLASDNALSMTMITADGENVVQANPDKNSDLFWGLCGGGGGNFGVLVDVEFKTHPAPPMFTWMSFSFHSTEQSELALKLIADSVNKMPDGLNVDMLIHKLTGYNQLVVDAVYSEIEMERFPLLQELRKIVDEQFFNVKQYQQYKVLSEEYARRHGYVHFERKPVYMKGSFLNDFPPQLAGVLVELMIRLVSLSLSMLVDKYLPKAPLFQPTLTERLCMIAIRMANLTRKQNGRQCTALPVKFILYWLRGITLKEAM